LSEDQKKAGPFVRKKLTPFLAHEMIYDYSIGQLDAERKAALEEFLAKDHESQVLLKNIGLAQDYAAKMSKVTVDAEILQQLSEAESAASLGKRYSSWKEWPETLRWSITAIVLSASVAGAVALVPWSKLGSSRKHGAADSVEVAQIAQPKPEDTTEVAANEDNGSGDEAPDDSTDESSGDDVADSNDGDESATAHAKKAAVVAAATPKITPTPQPTPVAVAVAKSIPIVNPPKPPVVAATAAKAPSPGTNASTQIAMSETADTHAVGDPKARGFVYRAFMTLNNLEDIAPKITDDIIALGGEKAGEVELGWKRGTGHYYHFVIPDDNQKKMLEHLQVYGPVRISKDPHPRIMPPGKVRFILWVESAPDSANN
jgi:hypothetical protein